MTKVMTPVTGRLFVVACGLAALAGCNTEHGEASGPTEHATKIIEMDKSELARVHLKMGAGELKVRGGSKNLLEADFTYNIPSWKPEVKYEFASFRSRLDIEQPSGHSSSGDHRYEWDLRLNDTKPLSLEMEFGAGKANLTLGSMNLREVAVNMGVGELAMDLRGQPKSDYDVRIHGGIGQVTVELPKDVGIVADAKGGIGSVDVHGLRKKGDQYVNDAYENNPKVTIKLEVKGGIGHIVLNAE